MANPLAFGNIIPLGKMTIATAGTTVLLSVNCGSLQGQTGGTYQSPAPAGAALRQIRISADAGNTKNIYILPRGKTLASNASLIIAALAPGESITLPQGFLAGQAMLPENFCLDTDTNGSIAYGCGFIG